MPATPISVAPKGILPPRRLDPEFDSGDAMALEESFADAETQPVLEVNPPPSNTEFAVTPGLPEPPDAKDMFDAQLPFADGLNPPGSISVAPNGIAALLSPPGELGRPSGDVAARRAVLLCAKLALELNRIATVIENNRNIVILSVLFDVAKCLVRKIPHGR